MVILSEAKNPESLTHVATIYVLSAVSLEENIEASQIEVFIENIRPDKQSDFRCCFSLNIVDQFHRTRDDSLNSALVTLDFSQAFDSVDVELLIAELTY